MPRAEPPPSRLVLVAPERLERWVAGFAARHGPLTSTTGPELVVLQAADGGRAECAVPFPPLPGRAEPPDPAAAARLLADHALTARTVGVILVRLGGHAAGVFQGADLVASKVGATYVQGRTAAGGWSQQRFARRRQGQARSAYAAAADVAARVVLPEVGRLDAVVTGGDRRAVTAVLGDPRLAVLAPLLTGPHLDVGDPRLAVLRDAPRLFRAIRVRVTDAAQS